MENPKPTSPEKVARQSYVLSQIRKIAAASNVALQAETVTVYADELAKLPTEALDHAVGRTIREWEKPSLMPPLAFILARSSTNPQLAAEAAWELLQKIIYRDWHPDTGWGFNKPPSLDAQLEYAIRQCGGLARIHDCPEDNFNWMRKEFIEAHTRYAAEDGAQYRLSEKQAADLLGSLQRGELPS